MDSTFLLLKREVGNLLVRGMFAVLVGVGFCLSPILGKAVASSSAPLIAAGSGVNLAITRLLAAGFVREDGGMAVEVPGSIGSNGAIKAVSEGAIPLGLISRPLKEEEQRAGMVVRPYARVALVIGAHPMVADEEISAQQLVEVLCGTRSKWRDGQEIVVQVREKFDSGFQLLGRTIPGFNEAYWKSLEDNRWQVTYTDQDANRALAATPYALGVTDAGMVATEQLDIKMLRFNGIAPTLAAIEDGTYPLSRDLFFLYREDRLTEPGRRFLDFVFSTRGGEILRAHNYLPLY